MREWLAALLDYALFTISVAFLFYLPILIGQLTSVRGG